MQKGAATLSQTPGVLPACLPYSQIAKEARGRLPPDFGCRSVGKRRQVGRRHRLHPLAAPRTTSSPEPPSARPSAGSADG